VQQHSAFADTSWEAGKGRLYLGNQPCALSLQLCRAFPFIHIKGALRSKDKHPRERCSHIRLLATHPFSAGLSLTNIEKKPLLCRAPMLLPIAAGSLRLS
jgi:hypothetical protein